MAGYPNQLKYYMWSFQVHYLINCQTTSESIFDKLDRGLSPKVIMFGFDDNYEHINFEPEEVDYLLSTFSNLPNEKANIYKNHPDKEMFYTGPGVQEEMDERLERECWREAIENTMNNSEDGKNYMFFVSNSVPIAKNNVYIVLGLNRSVYNSHSFLKTKFFNERYRIYTSLLETSVKAFLTECEHNLYLPNPGKSLAFDGRRSDELLRQAARDLMYTFSSKGQAFRGLHGLFDACNNISIHRYEGKENLGTLIIAPKDHDSIEYTLQLEEPFNLSEHRKSRKMLQLAKEGIGVICNTHQVLGLGRVKESYDPKSESVFYVKFRGVHCWDVWHQDKPILVMRYGDPQFLSEVVDKERFSSDCRRIFESITDDQIANLFSLAVGATKQKNGALLIVSDNAANEAERLSKQCLQIKPLKLNEEMLLSLSSIDGGVLVDRNGVAYAQGVILDGVVTSKGDSSRGSRYNSAVTYIDYKGKNNKTLIVVVSEDGMVDVIPNLRPQISKAEIERVIGILKSLPDAFNRGTYNDVMSWLTAREFYLSKEQCEIINSIKNAIEKDKFEGVQIIYQDLNPNEDMDDSYFLKGG